MGDVNFAYSFMEYFPMLLVVLILCNVFDVYGRILGSFGLSRFKFNDEATNERIEEGKNLLHIARHRSKFNRYAEQVDTTHGGQRVIIIKKSVYLCLQIEWK